MDDKVTITITTDKPVKVRVTPQDEKVVKCNEEQGLEKLQNEVKGGNGHVAKNYESRKANR